MRRCLAAALVLVACAHAPSPREAELEQRLSAVERLIQLAQQPAPREEAWTSSRAPAGFYLASATLSDLNPMRHLLGGTPSSNNLGASSPSFASSYTTGGTSTADHFVATGSTASLSTTLTASAKVLLDATTGAQLVYGSNLLFCDSTKCAASGGTPFQVSGSSSTDVFKIIDTTNSKTWAFRNNNDVLEMRPNAGGAAIVSITNAGAATFSGLVTGSAIGCTSNCIVKSGGSSAIGFTDSTGAIAPGAAGGWFFVQQAGTGTGSGNVLGSLNVNTTSTGNGGSCAAGVDLITYTLPASSLVTTGRCIRVKAWGTTANNATAKNIDLAIGATPTVLVTKALTVSIAGTWDVLAVLCRTGASTQSAWAEAVNNGGTTVSSTDGATVLKNTSQSTPALTETSTQLLRVRCITNVNAANDIVQKGLTVEFM